MSYFSEKSIVITGAASGLGRSLCILIASSKCHLILVDRDSKGLDKLTTKLREINSKIKISSILSDFTNLESIESLSNQLEKLKVDILVNNAGIVSGKLITDLKNQNIIDTYMVNAIAPQILTKSVLPNMINNNYGHIINLCSASSFVGVAKLSDYAASKAAIYSFDESLRLEMKKLGHNISTTAFCPFYINTGMFKGVKTRFSFLLPILEPVDVVKSLYEAIENKDNRVVLPLFIYSTFIIKLLPPRIYDWLLGFFGINSSMDEFTGRENI